MKRRIIILTIIFLALVVSTFISQLKSKNSPPNNQNISAPIKQNLNPLTIEAMRQRSYPGSDIKIEQTLPDGSNYKQYIASYKSDGLKIYALLTVPAGQKPKDGWPVIIFNHGYIDPQTYQTNPTVGQYAKYVTPFAENGYLFLSQISEATVIQKDNRKELIILQLTQQML